MPRKAHEDRLLKPADEFLEGIATHDDGSGARFEVLEAASAFLGGFSLSWFRNTIEYPRHLDEDVATEKGRALVDIIDGIPIHYSLSLASLAKPPVSEIGRKNNGAFYTDHRLARYLASHIAQGENVSPSSFRVVDPACGSGNLLAAATLELAGSSQKRRCEVVANSLFGVDLSPSRVRGALISVASLVDSEETISAFRRHLRVGDSLLESRKLWARGGNAPEFDVVIGNPPWRKLKVTRHDFLLAKGVEREYGRPYETEYSLEELQELRSNKREYVEVLTDRFDMQGTGDPDLYRLFTELGLKLLDDEGQLLFILPGGLVRAKGCSDIRTFFFDRAHNLELTLFENRARFFPVDTRKKFVVLSADFREGGRRSPILFKHADAEDAEIGEECRVRLGRTTLRNIEPDLTIPEVRSQNEWRIYRHAFDHGNNFGDPNGDWRPCFTREVDMTRDRNLFCRNQQPGHVPLMEGRMVHQFRHDAKAHVEGSGRSAIWDGRDFSAPCTIVPQYWLDPEELDEETQSYIDRTRAGFCDVTGQTNERSMLAARIPPGVVCGNKVPTIQFRGYSDSEHRIVTDCFLGIANSLCFDWLLRRNITTSVNYFILRKMPLPDLNPLSIRGRRIAGLAQRLGACRHTGAHEVNCARPDVWAMAQIRAEIEWRVCQAYSLSIDDLAVIMDDFPLLDRNQPPLPGESQSTVTRDTVLATAATMCPGDNRGSEDWEWRANEARRRGAIPFVPSHLSEAYKSDNVPDDLVKGTTIQ